MERSNRNLWIGLGVFAILLLVVLPSMGGGMLAARGMGGPGAFGFGARPLVGMPFLWGFWGLGLLARLLFFGLIAFVVMRLFRGRRYERFYRDASHPMEILQRRYASGEITREQYEDMRRTLEASATY
jgi:putative membrane protein